MPAPFTRLGAEGYGVQRIKSFAGKTPSGRKITRLALDGYGVRRYGSFAGKTPSNAVITLHVHPFIVTMGKLSSR